MLGLSHPTTTVSLGSTGLCVWIGAEEKLSQHSMAMEEPKGSSELKPGPKRLEIVGEVTVGEGRQGKGPGSQ